MMQPTDQMSTVGGGVSISLPTPSPSSESRGLAALRQPSGPALTLRPKASSPSSLDTTLGRGKRQPRTHRALPF